MLHRISFPFAFSYGLPLPQFWTAILLEPNSAFFTTVTLYVHNVCEYSRNEIVIEITVCTVHSIVAGEIAKVHNICILRVKKREECVLLQHENGIRLTYFGFDEHFDQKRKTHQKKWMHSHQRNSGELRQTTAKIQAKKPKQLEKNEKQLKTASKNRWRRKKTKRLKILNLLKRTLQLLKVRSY